MKRGTQVVFSGIFLVIETTVAFGVFFGAAYGLTRLAEQRAAAPVTPNADGVVTLPPNKAILRGGLTLYPMDFEHRTEDYGNEYGRALAKERNNRKIGNWKSVDGEAEWEFSIDPGGKYQVEVELAAPPEEAGSEIAVEIGSQKVSASVPNSGGRDEWNCTPLGRVNLAPGTHTLVLKATSVKNKTVMNVRRVVLRPCE